VKKSPILILTFLTFIVVAGCRSTGSVTYRLTLDPSINDQFVQAAWIAYSAPIRNDIYQYYEKNPKGNYTVPYDVEINARNSLMDFYLRVQNEHAIYDSYIEDIIKIRDSNKLDEYVFFSFNPGNWGNYRKFEKDVYTEWMEKNMPDHVPITLAHVEKIE
jgi:hypothetical protein